MASVSRYIHIYNGCCFVGLFCVSFMQMLLFYCQSVDDLQKMLDSLPVYSSIKWNINVNIDKTTIVVFKNRKKFTNAEKLIYNGNVIKLLTVLIIQ